MKKIAVYFIFLTIILGSCSDKTRIGSDQAASFIKFYGNAFEDYGNDIKQTADGGYVLVGTTTTIAAGLRSTTDIIFMKLDKYGNLDGELKTYGGTGNDKGNSIDIVPGDGYILAGSYATPDSGLQAYVVRLDESGNTIWEARYGSTADEEAMCVRRNPEGNYVIAGYSTVDGAKAKDRLMFEIDDSGRRLWNSLYGLNKLEKQLGEEEAHYFDFIGDGYLVIGSSSNTNGNLSRIYFDKTRSDGSAATYNTEFIDSSSTHIAGTNESGTAVIALESENKILLLGTSTSAARVSRIYLSRFDEFVFNTEPANRHDWYFGNSTNQYVAKSMHLLPDGKLAILATRKTSNSDICLLIIDINSGEKLAEYAFGDSNEQGAGAFAITSDGGFVITGYNLIEGNGMITVIKTLSNGVLE
jgi:hypothetical protein